MSFSIEELEVDNFMSISHAKIGLRQRGLVLISGDNRDNDAFQSNGAGKSAYFSEAPVWALYGQTIRDYKADEVINRKVGKNTCVRVVLKDSVTQDTFEIQRYRKHSQHGNHVLLFHNGSNITAKSDADTNVAIQELIGMDYMTFTNSVMFGQGVVKTFATSTDAEQKKILEQMLRIDVFRRAQELAKEKSADLKAKLFEAETELDSNINLRSNWQQKVTELQQKEAELGDKVQARIAELKAEKLGYEQALTDLPIDDAMVEEQRMYKALLDKAKTKIAGYQKQEDSRQEILGLIRSNERDVQKLNTSTQSLQKKLDALLAGSDTPERCTACGQELPVGDTSHVENHLKEGIEKNRAEVEELEADSKSLTSLLTKVEEQLKGKSKLEDQVDDIKKSITEVTMEITQLAKDKAALASSIQRTDSLIEEQERLLSTTYTDLIESTIADIKALQEDIKAIQANVESLKSLKDKYDFWIDAYGNQGIKSLLLDSVTPFLNKQCHHYTNRLTGNSIEVTFSTQQKILSGKNKGQLKDKFEVVVVNENGDESYRGNSGGEKRRVDVSIILAMQDLVFSRSNQQLDLIVFDEIFDALDAVGCERVIELLREKAEQYGTVLVVTHNENLKQMFNRTITVSKSGGKTILKEEIS